MMCKLITSTVQNKDIDIRRFCDSIYFIVPTTLYRLETIIYSLVLNMGSIENYIMNYMYTQI